MRISVIMPCYNAEAYVAEALRSAAAQSRPPDEIVVTDDGSTDGSLDAIRSSGVVVTLVRTERANGAGARNAAIERATGDWLAFLDADDVWKPHHLERFESVVGPGDVGYTGWCDHMHSDGTMRGEGVCRWPVSEACSGLPASRFLEWRRSFKHFAMLTTVVRRDRFLEVGGFDVEQVRRHDLDMWLRVIRGRTWSFNPEPTAKYRVVTGGVSRANWASSEYYHLRMLNKNAASWPELEDERRLWAKRAVVSALTDGGRADVRRVWPIASPHLSPLWRAVLGVNSAAPFAFRAANRLRRLVQNGKAGVPKPAAGAGAVHGSLPRAGAGEA